MNFREIKFSPYNNNVLDYVGRNLQTANGQPVTVTQSMRGEFIITIDGKTTEHLANFAASHLLNENHVGITE